jgi:SAM-dependent methyltransferase
LLDVESLRGRRVVEIGAGTGRFVRMFLEAGATHVTAVEPSAAFDVLKRNTADVQERLSYLQTPGDQLPPSADADFVFSIGVLHHIPDPAPVVASAYAALRPGGTIGIWVYGKEGNGMYLAALHTVVAITRRLPHALLAATVWALYWPLAAYMHACRIVNLPLAKYMREVLLKFDPPTRRLVLYDQLNPAYAMYYTEAQTRSLLERGGFTDIRLHHRHGYSWSAAARRPESKS